MLRLIYKRPPKAFEPIESTPFQLKSPSDILSLTCCQGGLIVGGVLEEVGFLECKKIIRHIGDILQPGEKLFVSGLDCVELSRLLYNEQISIEEYNSLLYPSMSSWNLITLDLVFKQIGVEPLLKRLGGVGNIEYFYIGEKK